MSLNVLLHTTDALDPMRRSALNNDLVRRLGQGIELSASVKPHLLFVSADPWRAPPHALLAAMRAFGVDARLVDL
jgi:hypothetical protein